MRAKFEQLSHRKNNQSFFCYEVNASAFEFLWHYHPEYELTYIVKGKGKRLVGDSYENFTDGDMVMAGPLLPHTWASEKGKNKHCLAIVIQFSAAFIEPLFQYPEMMEIKKLLSKAEKGLKFDASKNRAVVEIIKKMIHLNGIESFTSLINVLQKLAISKSLSLSSVQFKLPKGDENQRRINKVFQYVQANYKEKISLQKAAILIHLSESAFCKFFKRVSGKTFSDYVNDIRIANACQLLIETDKPISQIAFDSGFESLTYFNRVFLKKKMLRPGEFKKKE